VDSCDAGSRSKSVEGKIDRKDSLTLTARRRFRRRSLEDSTKSRERKAAPRLPTLRQPPHSPLLARPNHPERDERIRCLWQRRTQTPPSTQQCTERLGKYLPSKKFLPHPIRPHTARPVATPSVSLYAPLLSGLRIESRIILCRHLRFERGRRSLKILTGIN
jgi:hypothetical protein